MVLDPVRFRELRDRLRAREVTKSIRDEEQGGLHVLVDSFHEVDVFGHLLAVRGVLFQHRFDAVHLAVQLRDLFGFAHSFFFKNTDSF